MDPSIVGEFSRATLELTEVYFSLVDRTIYFFSHCLLYLARKLLKASKNGDSKSLLNVLALYDQTAFGMTLGIRAQSFIEFIDLLTRDFPVDRSVLRFCLFYFAILHWRAVYLTTLQRRFGISIGACPPLYCHVSFSVQTKK